jgi:hypothetical protein
MNDRNQQPSGNEVRATPRGSWRRRAVFVSVLFHLALLATLFFWVLPPYSATPLAQHDTSAPQTLPSPSSDSPPPRSVPAAPDVHVPPEQIEASIESQIKQVQNLSDEAKLSELEKNLRRLESISTEASVQEVTATIAESLGLQPGVEPSENDVSGSFDHDTAQLHDVARRRSDSGSWQYECVLVDAQGRTQSVPMTEAEGEPIYQAFEKMKQYPMAAGIYRQVVMPMIQNLIEASEIAEQVASDAESQPIVPPQKPSD